ncbi:hypothetical protein [Spirosoma litoris]
MHSKHVFQFPFRWDVKYIGKDLSKTPYGERTDLAAFHEKLTTKDASRWSEIVDFKTDTPEHYNAWTYFYPFVRKAIFPDANYRSYKQYTYELGQNATYQITIVKKAWPHFDKIAFEKTFTLALRSVTLNVYDLGVGVLSFSLENDTYGEPEDILQINDFGRRLYPQYIGPGFNLQYPQNSFLASSIQLLNEDKSLNIQSNFVQDYANSPSYLPPHILQLLDSGLKTDSVFFAEKLPIASVGIRIEPVLDDRMFVLCWYGRNQLVHELAVLTNTQYDLTKQKDFWYRYVFVDTDLTCPDPVLKNTLLKQTTYTRWAPEKTLFGVSRYTFVILTDEGDFASSVLSVHLTNIYTRLALIGLVQRAALLRFSGEVSYVSRRLKNTTELAFISDQVQELNRSYIQFDNRFFFKEVTAQEQGIELYDMLHAQMRLLETASDVKREISELNNYVQTANSETQRVTLERVSLLGGLFLVPSFLLSYLGWGILDFNHVPINGWEFGLIGFAFFALFCIGYKAFFAKPSEFKPNAWIFRVFLALIVLLVLTPAIGTLLVPEKVTQTQPVIDSTATEKIDSLRNEIRLLRQSIKQPTVSTPKTASVLNNKTQ